MSQSLTPEHADAVVIGAGFAGMYMLHRLRNQGLTVVVIEAGDDVGGTWYWNRYPGARCDVESLEYSYQFSKDLQKEWVWTERYATQPEILRYAAHVADTYDLRRDIRFNSRVTAARFSDDQNKWAVTTDTGQSISAKYVVMATGCLSSTNLPKIDGIDDFKGATYHTGRWPHKPVDFTGKVVGIVGTGSSAIQSIPIIAEQARHLYVFQRTPNFSIPAHNRPLDPAEREAVLADLDAFRAANGQAQAGFGAKYGMAEKLATEVSADERNQRFEERWALGGLPFFGAFADLMVDPAANEAAADFVRAKIRAIVKDPVVAARLSPDQTFGCKRLCVDSGYYETFNRPNVTLVDLRATPIERITPTGIATTDQAYALDDLIFATGFDAMTGSLLKIDIVGAGGLKLADKWAAGPRTYLGLQTAGFPNLFIITGPGSPSVLTNMLPSIEQHVNWIADCIDFMRARQIQRMEAEIAAEDSWVDHVNAIADSTLFRSCNSWYLGANVPGKPRVFMPLLGFPDYVRTCDEVAANGYRGFALTPAVA